MIRRKLFKNLLAQKEDMNISLIIGPRQVGKTTLLTGVFEELKRTSSCLFLDLDIYSNYEKVNTFENLKKTLELNGWSSASRKPFFLFLDEFQRYPGMTMILKNLFDHLPNVKVFATGSSSIAIKSEVQESLAGRKLLNYLFPLDFEEFLWFKDDSQVFRELDNVHKLKGEDLFVVTKHLYDHLTEFMTYGGYPRVVLNRNKEEILESIFDLYLKKDVIEYLKIEKVSFVKRLIEYLAINNGKKVKYEELSSACSLQYKEVKSYIELLKDSHICCELRPFFKNKLNELVKIPKIYFIDCGVRNYFIHNFSDISLRDDGPFLFETFILSELLKSGRQDINFWEDKNGHEVDFVAGKDDRRIPIEVKHKKILKTADFSGLNAYAETYKNKGYLVNLSIQKKRSGYELLLPYRIANVLK